MGMRALGSPSVTDHDLVVTARARDWVALSRSASASAEPAVSADGAARAPGGRAASAGAASTHVGTLEGMGDLSARTVVVALLAAPLPDGRYTVVAISNISR